MKMGEAREAFRRLVAEYFGDAHVFYADQYMARFPEPYITIKFNSYSRNQHEVFEKKDNYFTHKEREIVANIDLNIFTKGKQIGDSVVYANTALDDMESFLNFLDSDVSQFTQMEKGFSVWLNGEPRDYSEVIRESAFQYRSLANFNMRFTDGMYGDYGQNDNELPTSSGGGRTDMITDPHWIESVDYEEEDIN